MIPRLRSLFGHGVIVSRTFSTEARYVGGGEVEILLSSGKTIRLTSNKLARLANSSCLGKSGNTSVMVTAVSKPETSSSTSFMPLTVDYRQRSSAAGRIPTNFLRRELGPTEKEILTGRMIDRSLRPLFPKGFYADTQIVCNLLAVDGVNDPDVLAINAASAALATSDIPWNGPIGAIRVGLMGNNYDVVINPTRKELTESKLNMIVAGREDKNIFMIEASTTEPILMNYITKALSAAQKDIKRVVKGIKLLAEHGGKVKMPFEAPPLPTNEQLEAVRKEVTEALTNIFTDRTLDKLTRDDTIRKLTKETLEKLSQTFPESNVQLNQAFSTVFKQIYISIVRERGTRFDGRTLTELRPLHCEVGLFEPLHGSALFQRGQTQVLCSVALDSPNSVLKSDPVSVITGGLKEKNFMLHYEFPPFATKEISRMGGLNRRELGHGALAEKALRPLIPSDFPFTIRLTCDVLESNGSSSMASVCAGSMALMDAGVHIPENAAGVAMGLLKIDSDSDSDKETSDYILLTDIMGLEDYIGEMDFKIAGTKTAFTALQLDCKLSEGLPYSIVADALVKAHEAKGKIINVMNQCISSTKMSKETWPVSRKIRVPPHRRHRFLGFGGMNVKRLTAETGVQVTEDIEDPQSFVLFAPNKEAMEEGEEFIQKLLAEPTSAPELEFGAIYEVEIIELRDTGVLVSIHNDMAPVFVPNRELDMRKVGHPSALDLQVGQTISVKYFGRDPVSGHMRLSRRVLQMATPRAVKVPPVVDTSTP